MKPKRKQTILALSAERPDWTSVQIADSLGCHPSLVRATWKRNGVQRGKSKKMKYLQDWERQAILDAYRGGEKLEAIAAEFGCTIWCVSIAAKRAGLPRRTQGRH